MSAKRPPLVSVLVPAYNAARTIVETLSSVLRQTYPSIEVIVVNDGSTDATGSILADLETSARNLVVISAPNGGQCRARNRALGVAKGKYVAPLDADDLWHPRYLERLVGELERAGPGAVMAYSFVRRIDEAGFVTETKASYAVTPNAFHQMLAANVVGTGSGIVMRRTAALETGGYDTRVGGAEDYLMQLRMAEMGKVLAVPEYLVGYRTSRTSLSVRRYEMSQWSMRVLAIAQEEFANADPRIMRRALARSFADASVHALKSGQVVNSVSHLSTALFSSPGEALRTLSRKARSARQRRHVQGTKVHFEDMSPTDSCGQGMFESPALAEARRVDERGR